MEYSKLISVTGLGGLYELISSRNDGALVKSLEDKSTRFVSSRVHNFSHLESIEVYTQDDNVNLAEVFNAMSAAAEKLPDEKDAKAVKQYFEKVFPRMDMARVYNSDMKKMIRWFQILGKNNVEVKLSQAPEEAEEIETETAPAVTEKTPKKSAKTKAPAEEKQVEEAAPKPKKAASRKPKE